MSESMLVAVVRRPRLWAIAVAQVFRLAPNGWWRRAPFLPLPDKRYLQFRMETQYGDAMHRPEGNDVVTYLSWCRAHQRELRSRRRDELSRSRAGA
ncbi:MAG: hypothetical protein ACO28X_04015 [Ilumatobacteraceae bacterium]|jgi:hypothetical protein